MDMTYDWLAALAYIAVLVALTIAGKKLVFSIPVMEEMRLANRDVDKTKMSKESFRAGMKTSENIGKYTNLGFFLTILPFTVSFDSRPIWQHLLEIVAILAIFDFMYYWTHRSLFHGQILRKVHSLHHQARQPTWADSLYVHPLETFIGLMLFLLSMPIVALIEGAPLHAGSAAIATLIFTQLNTVNHVFTKLPADNWFFRSVDYITGVHHAHHVDMNQGNFATLTMFYDKLFGTFEAPVKREAA
jgi:sterol desaturase/sphingolipid hydroxylase (fatty acid hydroxylase superfamily)